METMEPKEAVAPLPAGPVAPEPNIPQMPTMGRIVRFVLLEEEVKANNNATESPAIVVRVWGTTIESAINLKVFADAPNDLWKTSVPYSAEKKPGTWHWPEFNK